MSENPNLQERTRALLENCVIALEQRRAKLGELPFMTDGENLACRFILNAYKASLVDSAQRLGTLGQPLPDLPVGQMGPVIVDLKDLSAADLRRIGHVA